ncbi:MAG: hypothetical protein GF335_04010 [Candidatus Moranbacteria bacterium]|nr:hypothetical protein [Candidatus Moranbacteria bacterium]
MKEKRVNKVKFLILLLVIFIFPFKALADSFTIPWGTITYCSTKRGKTIDPPSSKHTYQCNQPETIENACVTGPVGARSYQKPGEYDNCSGTVETIDVCRWCRNGEFYLDMTASLDKQSYCIGDQATLQLTGTTSACLNSPPSHFYIKIDYDGASSSIQEETIELELGETAALNEFKFSVPSLDGQYEIYFYSKEQESIAYKMPYIVENCTAEEPGGSCRAYIKGDEGCRAYIEPDSGNCLNVDLPTAEYNSPEEFLDTLEQYLVDDDYCQGGISDFDQTKGIKYDESATEWYWFCNNQRCTADYDGGNENNKCARPPSSSIYTRETFEQAKGDLQNDAYENEGNGYCKDTESDVTYSDLIYDEEKAQWTWSCDSDYCQANWVGTGDDQPECEWNINGNTYPNEELFNDAVEANGYCRVGNLYDPYPDDPNKDSLSFEDDKWDWICENKGETVGGCHAFLSTERGCGPAATDPEISRTITSLQDLLYFMNNEPEMLCLGGVIPVVQPTKITNNGTVVGWGWDCSLDGDDQADRQLVN